MIRVLPSSCSMGLDSRVFIFLQSGWVEEGITSAIRVGVGVGLPSALKEEISY